MNTVNGFRQPWRTCKEHEAVFDAGVSAQLFYLLH